MPTMRSRRSFKRAWGICSARGHKRCSTLMCSEALWWRCHRRIVADYLIAAGKTVFHIMDQGRLEPACLTPGAVVQSGGAIVYPATHRSDPCA